MPKTDEEEQMPKTDEDQLRDALEEEALRKRSKKRYPGRPKVKGEHYGIWKWPKPGKPFRGKIGGSKRELVFHRHRRMSFPERTFPELEKAGFGFVQWAAA
ncbi:MAG: hypothetical protein GWN58_06710 [Anaerolineae bacterium]|nr:hypothetical protein [Anaerolineae bacterium]